MILWLQSVQAMVIKAVFLMLLERRSCRLGGLAKATLFLRRSMAWKFRHRRSPKDSVFVFLRRLRLAFPGASAVAIEDLERVWWKELVRRVWEPWNRFRQFDEYFDELFAYFAQPKAWTLYPEVTETLSALEKRGIILSVISNFDSRLIGILEGLGVAHSFEHIFVSSRVGYAKPDRQIFHIALERHNLKASDAVHVGDSEEKDLHGANKAGLKGVLVDRNGEINSSRITSLLDILSLSHD